MLRTPTNETVWRVRLWNKDLGVAVALLITLAIGWLLMVNVEGRTRSFSDPDGGFSIAFPERWIEGDSLLDLLLKVENPAAASPFKTALGVERRDLDPANPPTLQTLLDRRVEERELLTGYHLLSDEETTVDGAPALVTQYAYVVQPIDEPRRAATPVVVVAREYIVISGERSYYINLAVAEADEARVRGQFERIIQSVELQP
jgi:hypothetical protein